MKMSKNLRNGSAFLKSGAVLVFCVFLGLGALSSDASAGGPLLYCAKSNACRKAAISGLVTLIAKGARAIESDSRVFGRTTTGLNIRSGPSHRHSKLAGSPLRKSARLEIHGAARENRDWYYVTALDPGWEGTEGYVNGKYVRIER